MSQSGFKCCLYFDQLSAQATDKPTADSDIADAGDPDMATATETEVDGDDDEEDSDDDDSDDDVQITIGDIKTQSYEYVLRLTLNALEMFL